MKRAFCTTLVALATAVALPPTVHAQIVMSAEAPDGTNIPVSMGENGGFVMDGSKYKARAKDGDDQLQKLLTQGTGDGKHPIVILDSVRADEKALNEFTSSLRDGTVHIKKGGVRILAGDDKEAAKYGAGADDKVIIISTEPASGNKAEPASKN